MRRQRFDVQWEHDKAHAPVEGGGELVGPKQNAERERDAVTSGAAA